MDLPFSPRAAFIWDHTQLAIVWMNAAARKKFGLDPKGLSDALPKSLTRKFAQFLKKTESGEAACAAVKLKIARHPAFHCCLEVLELAGGNRGVVIAESAGQQSIPAPPRSHKAPQRRKLRSERKTGAAARQTVRKTPPQRLTPEELRSFKAIGRAIRKLCREKHPAAPQALPAAGGLLPYEPKRPAGRVQAALCLPVCAFDAVLLLDKKLIIVGSEGCRQCLGWRKPDLLGRAAGQILAPGEQVVFYRMVKKLRSSAVQICRETIIVADGTGSGKPCHAVLGYWGHGDAHYFLALLTLKIPRRLKRLQHQPVSVPSITRLAA